MSPYAAREPGAQRITGGMLRRQASSEAGEVRYYSHGQYMAPPGPCPRCKGPTHYEADGPHRRKPARYYDHTKAAAGTRAGTTGTSGRVVEAAKAELHSLMLSSVRCASAW